MATQKPISTISYNSESFLRDKLEAWYKAHIIQAYTYICHKGEDGDKDHIHLRIEPNRRIDPMELTEALKEYDKTHPDKPLGVRPWRPSKEEDWILYAVHEPRYMRMKYGDDPKGEKLPYQWEQITASDGFDVETAFIRACSHMEHTSGNLMRKITEGVDPVSLALEGNNPFMISSLLRLSNGSNEMRTLRDENDRLKLILEQFSAWMRSYEIQIKIDSENRVTIKDPFEKERANAQLHRHGIYTDVNPFDDDLDL